MCFQAYHIDAFFRRASSAAHTNDRGLTMVDLFCCTGTIAGQVPAAGSEVLSRVNASGREVLAAYSALFDHGLASKSDQRFASIRSTGNLTFSTAF